MFLDQMADTRIFAWLDRRKSAGEFCIGCCCFFAACPRQMIRAASAAITSSVSRRRKNAARLLLVATGIGMMCFGAMRGEAELVLGKAIRLCLECVGIG